MSDFNDISASAADFNEAVMGEAFTYTTPAGVTTSGLAGVFNQAQAAYAMDEFATRRTVDLVCVSGKTQWGAVVPAARGTVTYNAIGYTIEDIDGLDSPGEQCYQLTLKRLS